MTRPQEPGASQVAPIHLAVVTQRRSYPMAKFWSRADGYQQRRAIRTSDWEWSITGSLNICSLLVTQRRCFRMVRFWSQEVRTVIISQAQNCTIRPQEGGA